MGEYGASSLQYQGVGIRFVETIIDIIILGIITTIISLPFGLTQTISEANVTSPSQVVSTSMLGVYGVISVVVFLLCYILLEGTYGQTVGKMVVKIRVVHEDGSKIGYGAAAIRTILRYIDEIPFIIPYLLGAILIWSSDKKQRLGDHAAHTVVVKV